MEAPSRRYRGRGLNLTTHLHLVPRLRMSGAVPQFPVYVFTALYLFTEIITTYLFCDSCSTTLRHELLHNISEFGNSLLTSLVLNIRSPTHRWNELIFQRLVLRLRHSTSKYWSNENMKCKFITCFWPKFVSDDVIMLARSRSTHKL